MQEEKRPRTPGPFEFGSSVSAEPVTSCHATNTNVCDGQAAQSFSPGAVWSSDEPHRSLDCVHYEECLNLAAALNWASFTCEGCDGSVNPSLLWRAHQSARKDSVARRLCGLPPLVMVRGTRSDDESNEK